MNNERFDRAIWIMENVADDAHLDLHDWVCEQEIADGVCGTTYCIGGYCAIDPVMQSAGLSFGHFLYPVFDGSVGVGALFRFFDLPPRDAEALFVESARKIETVAQCVAMLKHYRETQTVIYPE